MSVLIKGMEMPECCFACRLNVYHSECAYTGNEFHSMFDEFDPGKERHPDCPLIEVPPHGRLIDADALEEYWKPDHSRHFDADYFIHTIESAPTIIESEGK